MIGIFLIWLASLGMTTGYAAEVNEFVTLPLVKPSSSQSSHLSLGIGLGITGNFDLNPLYSIETGIVYLKRSFVLDNSAQTSYRLSMIHIPVMLRYRLNETISIGGGLYGNNGLGNVVQVKGDETNTIGYQDIPWSKYDFGVVAGIRYKKIVYEFIHIFADARILLGILNIDKGDQSLHNRELQIWTGFGFSL